MQEQFEGNEEELEKLRLENEIKKIKLSLEHGLDLSKSYSGPELPPEVEGEFLDHIREWEEQFALRKRIVVYDFIERPEFMPVDNIDEDRVKVELERVLEIMKGHGVFIDTLCDVEDRELYRFIIEEFFKEEMDDIRIDGMMHCFTYEDYHPNHEYDINRRCREFVEYIIDKREKEEGAMESWCLAGNIQAGEKIFTKEEFAGKLGYFRAAFSAFTIHDFEQDVITLNDAKDDAEANYHIRYSADIEGSAESVEFEGSCRLWLKRDDEWWSVYRYEMPGVVV